VHSEGHRWLRRSGASATVAALFPPPDAATDEAKLAAWERSNLNNQDRRDARVKRGACTFCGVSGHKVNQCPVKPQPSHGPAAPAPRRSRSPAPRERSRSPGRSGNQRPPRADARQDARAEEREAPRKRGCGRSRSRERDVSLPRVLCTFGCGEFFKPGATPRLAGRAPGQCACHRFARLAAALESDRALARARAPVAAHRSPQMVPRENGQRQEQKPKQARKR
jgi:hypothetical protein